MNYILLVDDDKDLNEATADVLRQSGYEVEYRLDTKSALQCVHERTPDLLVLDIMFPESDVDGFTFVQDLNIQFKGKKKFPILMVSAIKGSDHPEINARNIDAQWMPVTDFLQKPVDFSVLKLKVAELLANARQPVD